MQTLEEAIEELTETQSGEQSLMYQDKGGDKMDNLLNDMALKLDIKTIEGISYEIQACLESEARVKEFKFVNDDSDKYNIMIYVDRLEHNGVHQVFKGLFNFLEYNAFAAYERTIYDDAIEYIMISSSDKVTGYYCKFTFKKV